MRKFLAVAGSALALMLGLVAMAPGASAETGNVIAWSSSVGSGGQSLVNHNLYIIDHTDYRFPVATVTSEWQVRTGVPVLYRAENTAGLNCGPVHCAHLRQENLGATTWRVRWTHAAYDAYGEVISAEVTINTYYSWDVGGTVSKSGACQAVAKGMILDYTRSATDYRSCMSSAMRYTVGNANDDAYARNAASFW